MKNNFFSNLFESELNSGLNAAGTSMEFKAGDIIVQPGKYIKVIPLLLKGTIKVVRVDGNGNELFLYHIEVGQSCAVSLSACLMDKLSNIRAVAEDDIELIAVSASLAKQWFERFAKWRLFVLTTMDNRYTEIINTLDSVAFKKTDERLIEYLTQKAKAIQSNSLNITHQEIATELSTSREVISRLLKQLEQQGRLQLFRNKIALTSPV